MPAAGAGPRAEPRPEPAPRSEPPSGSVVRMRVRLRRISRLHLRILAVNVLALVILAAGFLWLGGYEGELVAAERSALAMEAQVFAAMLAEAAVPRIERSGGAARIDGRLAREMASRLATAIDSRVQIFGPDGDLLADSHLIEGPVGGRVEIAPLAAAEEPGALSRGWRVLREALRVWLPGPGPLPRFAAARRTVDAAAALTGVRAATAWRSPDDRILLTAAAPVQQVRRVVGAVQLTRPARDIDAALLSVRNAVLQAFALALAVSVALSLYLARTLARPIRQLAQAAERVRSQPSRAVEIPDLSARGDEIGELSAALSAMTRALWDRMEAIERFAADVAHELKNPLSSLQSAVETAARVPGDADKQARLMAIIEQDVRRLDRLITDISGASRLDAELARHEPEQVDLGPLLEILVALHDPSAADAEAVAVDGAVDGAADGAADGAGAGAGAASDTETEAETGPQLRLDLPDSPGALCVQGNESRLMQVFENLLTNALSFAPPGGEIRIRARRESRAAGAWIRVTVADDGPGLPPGTQEQIFQRFYSERPGGEAFGQHSGLGLSIARQIVAGHQGRIHAANRRDVEPGAPPGALFTVELPAA